MNLPTRNFADIVRDMSAAITASAGRLVDVSVGSVLRAIIEANAAVALWVQWLLLLTLQATRAATSTGSDLDSWMADFSLVRLPAEAASGTATFSRYSGGSSAFVPSGTMIKTQDGSLSFVVTVDTANPAWQPSMNGYSLASGVTSIDLPISASVPGLSGNVLPSTITVLASSLPGIDMINNSAATNGGVDPETDAALRTRFTNYFASRSRATLDAIGYAISSVETTLDYAVQENVDASGANAPGNILIVVNDGSGSLAQGLMDSLSVAVQAVRPIGTTFSIQPPQIIQVQLGLSLALSPTSSAAAIQATAQSAVTSYISSLPIGGTLSITRIGQLMYGVDPGIINVAGITLNGGSVDLIAPPTSAFFFQSVGFN